MEEKTTIVIMSSVISTVPLIDLPNQYRRNTSTNVRNTMSMKTPMPAALSHLERLSAGSSAAVALSRKPVPWVCVLSILRFLVGGVASEEHPPWREARGALPEERPVPPRPGYFLPAMSMEWDWFHGLA